MYQRRLQKPDGRKLLLYSRNPIPGDIRAPGPGSEASSSSHLRWHPLRGEWVAYAESRQNRIFLPPDEYNPLAPTTDPDHPTELPGGAYDIAVFDNLFPTFRLETVNTPPTSIVDTRVGRGVCEVVVFTQNQHATLASLPLWHLELLIEVWADRYVELGALPDVQYVMPFENRGVEVGVTLHHPHGQIYAYPMVPPIPTRELERQRAYFAEHRRGLLEHLIEAEMGDGRRIIHLNDRVVAFIPACARYSYEVWIAPRRPASSLAELDSDERRDLALALKTVLLKFDGLWARPFPYVMVFHQAPTDGAPHPEAHLHLEFYPPYRMQGRLKYLAGSELGAGLFTADTLPELKAEELRAVEVSLE
jgi:UDPglucose--hexose-1-phosphate uridylyltransferase